MTSTDNQRGARGKGFLIVGYTLVVLGCSTEPLGRAQVEIAGHVAQVQVAHTSKQQEAGFRARESMGTDGMLFPIGQPRGICLDMENVKFPLSAAFYDQSLSIIQIVDMESGSTTRRCSIKPAAGVLEMPLHWFRDRKIGIDAKIRIQEGRSAFPHQAL